MENLETLTMRERKIANTKFDHPSHDVRRKKAMAIAAKRRQSMKFENEADKQDYEKLVASNPKNDGLYGMPRMALFPPEHIRSLSFSTAGLPECQCDVPNAEFDENGDLYLNCRTCGEPIRKTRQEVLDLMAEPAEKES